MWKESYRIGIEAIDNQHMKLFQTVDELLLYLEKGASREDFEKAVCFLKDYAVTHFRDEEAYQASIGYQGLMEHQRAHREFTVAVENFERQLIESGFSISVLKELAGMLTTWLIYHVADADQRIVGNRPDKEALAAVAPVEAFVESTISVLETMTSLSPDTMSRDAACQRADESIFIRILLDDKKDYGNATFSFSKEFACGLVSAMTFMEIAELDELAKSALAEFCNIVSGNAVTALSAEGRSYNMGTPVLCEKPDSLPPAGACLATGFGCLHIWVDAGCI